MRLNQVNISFAGNENVKNELIHLTRLPLYRKRWVCELICVKRRYQMPFDSQMYAIVIDQLFFIAEVESVLACRAG
jgi:hypothetical protein